MYFNRNLRNELFVLTEGQGYPSSLNHSKKEKDHLKKLTQVAFPILALSLLFAGMQANAEKNIVQTAAGNKQLSILVTAIKKAGLVKVLSSHGPFTVFAPTNRAFVNLKKKIGSKKFAAILNNKKALTSIITYHVLGGRYQAEQALQLANGYKAKTAEGSYIILTHNKNGVFVNNGKLIKTDIECANGVLHVINAVLLPPDLTKKMMGAKGVMVHKGHKMQMKMRKP